jgi:signal peptidase II
MEWADARFHPSMRATTARLVFLGLLTLLVGCDHATKSVAKAALEGEHPRDLIHGVVDLQYRENTDMAFNLLRWIPEDVRRPTLLAGGALALLALVTTLLRRPPKVPLVRVALLLVTAGAVGNYLDRLTRGYVVDFVHVHHWPVFNVADAYLTMGGVLLAVATMGARRVVAES